jgi:hypothetical protein
VPGALIRDLTRGIVGIEDVTERVRKLKWELDEIDEVDTKDLQYRGLVSLVKLFAVDENLRLLLGMADGKQAGSTITSHEIHMMAMLDRALGAPYYSTIDPSNSYLHLDRTIGRLPSKLRRFSQHSHDALERIICALRSSINTDPPFKRHVFRWVKLQV